MLPEIVPFGRTTSPAYSPDGRSIAYVMEGRSASGAAEPSIWIYAVASGKARQLTNAGYRFPSWSPDGRYIAATRDIDQKLDIVVLDASTGAEIASVTSDGTSQMPVWSPAGDALRYMHVAGAVADIETVRFSLSGPAFTFQPPVSVTQNTGVEQTCHPAWYIPAS